MAEGLHPDIIFVLAGQSNMAGRGAADSAPPEVAEVLQLVGAGNDARWEVAREPLHRDVDAAPLREAAGSIAKAPAGVGPGTEFGARLAEAIDAWRAQEGAGPARKVRVGLVPTAVGATRIESWVPGGVLFENMAAQAAAARRLSPGAALGGVLYYQGESDAQDEARARAFPAQLDALVAGLGARLGLGAAAVLVLCAVTGGLHRLPFRNEVRAALLAAGTLWDPERGGWAAAGPPGGGGAGAAAARAPSVAVVDAARYELQDDALHLTGPAARALGRDLAAAAWATPALRAAVAQLPRA